jgi:xylulose-5-phosphate/fructose-6-phosphate phosphoketolase
MSSLSNAELRRLDAWWRAANYLSVGQIYLLDNALLREPLTLDHVKPRLLGHWGTTPGLTSPMHMNRAIAQRDLDALLGASSTTSSHARHPRSKPLRPSGATG